MKYEEFVEQLEMEFPEIYLRMHELLSLQHNIVEFDRNLTETEDIEIIVESLEKWNAVHEQLLATAEMEEEIRMVFEREMYSDLMEALHDL